MFVLSVIIIIIIIIKADRRFGKYHVIYLFIIESYTRYKNKQQYSQRLQKDENSRRKLIQAPENQPVHIHWIKHSMSSVFRERELTGSSLSSVDCNVRAPYSGD